MSAGDGEHDVRQVKTREVIVDKAEEVKDPIYFLEKQANRGGYGLMMPATDTKNRLQSFAGKRMVIVTLVKSSRW